MSGRARAIRPRTSPSRPRSSGSARTTGTPFARPATSSRGRLPTAWALEPLVPGTRHDLYGQMVSLRLPDDAPPDLQERLYDEHRIEIPAFERNGLRLIRASFQGYNDARDLERLRSALAALL